MEQIAVERIKLPFDRKNLGDPLSVVALLVLPLQEVHGGPALFGAAGNSRRILFKMQDAFLFDTPDILVTALQFPAPECLYRDEVLVVVNQFHRLPHAGVFLPILLFSVYTKCFRRAREKTPASSQPTVDNHAFCGKIVAVTVSYRAIITDMEML